MNLRIGYLAVLWLAFAAAAQGATFIDMGALTGGEVSHAYAMSPDGTVVAGDSNGVPAIWTAANGIVALSGGLGGSAKGVGIDASGNIVVGVNTTVAGSKAQIWIGDALGNGSYMVLPLFNGQDWTINGLTTSFPAAAPDVWAWGQGTDGSGCSAAIRWKQSSNSTTEFDHPSHNHSYAYGGSRRGDFSGQYQEMGSPCGGGARNAFKTVGGSKQKLATLIGGPSNQTEASAKGMSVDGLHVVGWSDYPGQENGGYFQICIWRSGSTTPQAIPFLSGTNYNKGESVVNGYGTVVAGWNTGLGSLSKPQTAIVSMLDIGTGTWTTSELRQLLIDEGIDMSRWTLTDVRGISQDGSSLCGVGKYDHDGDGGAVTAAVDRGWIVTGLAVPPIPAPAAPTVRRPVYETDTTVTVENIRWDASQVDLYKNGVLLDSKPVLEGTASVVFSVPAHSIGDYYTATQTTPGGTSGQSGRKACVLPTVIDLTHLDPGFEGAAFDECWHVAGGNPELATAPDPSHGQSMKERGTSEGGVMGQIWADITPLTPTRYEPIVYSFWMYHTAGSATEEHFGRIFDYSGNAFGDGSTRYAFQIGVMPHTNNGVYQGQHGSYRFNLDEDGDGQPARATGWHRMAIKIWRTDEFGTTGKVYWYVDGQYGNDGDQTFDLSNTIDSIDLGNKNTATSDGLSAFYDDVSVVQASNQSPYMVLTPINATEGQAIVPTDQLGEDDDEVDSVVLTVLNPEAMPSGLTLSATSARGKPAVITVSGTPGAGTSTGGDGSGTYTIDLRAVDDVGTEVLDTLFIKVGPPSGCAEVPQDADKDGDVDVNDFAVFQACFNGPGMPWPPPPVPQDKCACLDQDDDGDVDVNDFAVFQTCFNGASNPPGC